MSRNLPPLLDNWCFSLRTEIARKLMLWTAEALDHSPMKYRAASYADEVDALVEFRGAVLEKGAAQHAGRLTGTMGTDEIVDDLTLFILTRHANHFWGGNIKLPIGVSE